MSIGWVDKIFWRCTDVYRPKPGEDVLRPLRGGWHAFKRAAGSRTEWVPLCDAPISLARSGGQGCMRPPVIFRCVDCDAAEARRRGKAERPDHLTLNEAMQTRVICFEQEGA